MRVQKQRSEQQNAVRQEAPAQQAQQKQAAPREQDLDPKLRSWMSKNESWFNKDAVMTGGVKAIHEQLVGVEDYDPTSDEYYAEIDRRMRKEFPHKFQEQRQNAQTVGACVRWTVCEIRAEKDGGINTRSGGFRQEDEYSS